MIVYRPPAMDPRNWGDGSSRGWGASWRDAEARDPRLPGAEWCVDLRLGGATIRVASGPVQLREAATGLSRSYRSGLASNLEIDEKYEPGTSSGTRSIQIEIPNALVDGLAQVRTGFILSGEAEVFLAIDNTTYEDRLVALDGDVSGGVNFDTVEGSLLRTSVTDPQAAGLPITPYLIEPRRFSAATTSAYGQRFPYVFGEAYRVSAALVTYNSATGAARGLVCVPQNGGEITKVYVGGTEYAAADLEYAWVSQVMMDNLGGTYLGVQFTGGTHVWTGDESVTVDVTGAKDQYLHEAIRALLEGYTTLGRRRIHYELLGDIVARLGSVQARLYINGSGAGTAATAMGAIEGSLLESFPMISMVWTDGKYGPVVTDARAPTRAELVFGTHLLARVSGIEESDKSKLRNAFTVLYNYNYETDAFDSVAVRSPDNSVLCSRSAESVGLRYADPIEANEVHTDDAAGYVLDWLVYHTALPSYYLEYSIPLAYLMRLRLGWNVALTDSQLDLDGITATVTRRLVRRGVGVVGLRIYWPALAGVGSGGGASGGGNAGGGGGIQ